MGILLPLSGAQSSFGQDAIKGARLAVETLNESGGVLGRPLELEIRDTHSKEQATVEAVVELAGDARIPALVGEIASIRTLAAARKAEELGIPLIVSAATLQEITEGTHWVYRCCYADPFPGEAMAKFARSLDANRAALIVEEGNPYSAALAGSFREEFEEAGGILAAEVTIPSGDADLQVPLATIKAANPDVIFLPSYYAEAARIIREARQAGIGAPFLGGDGWDSEEFTRQAGADSENCYFVNHFSASNPLPENELFSAAYETQFGTPPPPLAALTYDAIRLTASAIAAAGSLERAKIREALAATRDFPGVTGTISFANGPTPAKPAIIFRVGGGKFTYLETVTPPEGGGKEEGRRLK